MVTYFRFEDLEIWKEAIRIAIILFDIADEMEEKKLWRFAALRLNLKLLSTNGYQVCADEFKNIPIRSVMTS